MNDLKLYQVIALNVSVCTQLFYFLTLIALHILTLIVLHILTQPIFVFLHLTLMLLLSQHLTWACVSLPLYLNVRVLLPRVCLSSKILTLMRTGLE